MGVEDQCQNLPANLLTKHHFWGVLSTTAGKKQSPAQQWNREDARTFSVLIKLPPRGS